VDKYIVKHTIKSCIDQSSQTNKIQKKKMKTLTVVVVVVVVVFVFGFDLDNLTW
jgi:hypothetical protein